MEFQAVVLAAGRGSGMRELTNSCPKGLLPVANRPMIWYPLRMLVRAGFDEIIVVVLKSMLTSFREELAQFSDINAATKFVPIPDDEAEYGTAHTLRFVIKDLFQETTQLQESNLGKKQITDIIVVSCDFISNIELHSFVNLHRVNDAALTMLFGQVPQGINEAVAPGPKIKRTTERDLIGFDAKEERVIFYANEADLEEGCLDISGALFERFPQMKLRLNLSDMHLYIMKKYVIDFLVENPKKFQTLRGELIPYLIDAQWRRPEGDEIKKDVSTFIKNDCLEELARSLSIRSNNGATGDGHSTQIQCFGFIANDQFCVRLNNIGAYAEVNKQLVRLLSTWGLDEPGTNTISPGGIRGENVQIGTDSLVGGGTSLGGHSLVKRSIIGGGCTIGERVKIANSVIFDRVVIEDGASVHGSIICSLAKVRSKCEVKDSIIGHSQELTAAAKITNLVVGTECEGTMDFDE